MTFFVPGKINVKHVLREIKFGFRKQKMLSVTFDNSERIYLRFLSELVKNLKWEKFHFTYDTHMLKSKSSTLVTSQIGKILCVVKEKQV